MAERSIKRVKGHLTAEQKRRHQRIRKQVERNKAQLTREAMAKKAELIALHEAMVALKHEREMRGLSLGDVAERSGIDKSRLSKLENDAHANPTMATLTRIADAIGVRLAIHLSAA